MLPERSAVQYHHLLYIPEFFVTVRSQLGSNHIDSELNNIKNGLLISDYLMIICSCSIWPQFLIQRSFRINLIFFCRKLIDVLNSYWSSFKSSNFKTILCINSYPNTKFLELTETVRHKHKPKTKSYIKINRLK